MKTNWPICGHEKILDFLSDAVAADRVSHAYIFVGPDGLGKMTVAREFMAAVLCRGAGQKPCGQCRDCQQFFRGLHPDFYLVKREADEKTGKLKKDIAIDQIRDLKTRLEQGTFFGGFKTALIDEAHYLSVNAANGLLKVLEEPTSKTLMILIANNLKALPRTIVSRCQVIKFLPVAEKTLEKFLTAKYGAVGADTIAADTIATGARPTLSQSRIREICRLSFGRPGRALVLADQPEAFKNYEEHLNGFFALLAAPLWQRIKLAENLIAWDADEANNASQIKEIFRDWQTLLRDFLLLQNDNQALLANVSRRVLLDKYNAVFPLVRIKDVFYALRRAETFLRQNIGSKNILENLMVNL